MILKHDEVIEVSVGLKREKVLHAKRHLYGIICKISLEMAGVSYMVVFLLGQKLKLVRMQSASAIESAIQINLVISSMISKLYSIFMSF
jgi:hypothetical protein